MATPIEWAENEVKLAIKNNKGEGETADESLESYVNLCYQSALKAYRSLCEDEHSGMSFHITASILKRLLDGKPLTPIEDTDDIWSLSLFGEDEDHRTYQCSRKFSLFKCVYKDGTVKYKDLDRAYGVDKNNPDITFGSNLIHKYIDEKYPIAMPYTADDVYKIVQEEKFNYVAFLELYKNNVPVADFKPVYFKDTLNIGYIEITKEEYENETKVDDVIEKSTDDNLDKVIKQKQARQKIERQEQ